MFIIMNYILGESFSKEDFASLEIFETSLKINHINYFIKAKSPFFPAYSATTWFSLCLFISVGKKKTDSLQIFQPGPTYIINFK